MASLRTWGIRGRVLLFFGGRAARRLGANRNLTVTKKAPRA